MVWKMVNWFWTKPDAGTDVKKMEKSTKNIDVIVA